MKHRVLAKNAILTEYNEKKQRKMDRRSGYEEGLENGLSQGIEAFILDNIDDGFDNQQIMNKLILRFQLNSSKAQEYIEKYRK